MTRMAEPTARGAPVLDDSTKIAYESMRASYERIMMAWIGTATSLITFGFSIYKFFQIEAPPSAQQNYLIGPREFALALVSIGLFSLLLATVEHSQAVRALRVQYGTKRRSLAGVVAVLISILGIFALLAMIFRE
jgi:putative membrane protein